MKQAFELKTVPFGGVFQTANKEIWVKGDHELTLHLGYGTGWSTEQFYYMVPVGQGVLCCKMSKPYPGSFKKFKHDLLVFFPEPELSKPAI